MPGVSMRLIFCFVPFEEGQGGGQRVLPGNRLVVVVGDGGAFVDFAEPVDGAGIEQSSAETSCVLPAPLCPTTATLRMPAASKTFIRRILR